MVHKNINSSQIRISFFLLVLILSWVFTQAINIHATNYSKVQEDIARKIIRFHVIANSDSKEDQELKYLVKDALIKSLQPFLKEAESINESRDIINSKLSFIQNTAVHVIEENGYEYSVSATLSPSYFPMKVYGNYAFPCGYYEALQIKIGKAEGKNWWCVMFPPLCFVDETYSIVDEEGEEKLEFLLEEDELDALKNNKVPVKVKFKLLDIFKKMFS